MAYSKIALIGAGGELGRPVLKRLVDSGKFDITVIARENSPYTSPFPSVNVQKLDLQNQEALTSALQGVDAVVMTIGMMDYEASTKAIVTAAIAAGVKRIIPSDYGSDLQSPNANAPFFALKKNVDKYIEEKAAAGEIEYTLVFNGSFFDWALKQPDWSGFDISKRKATVYDGGDVKIMCTTLDSVGQAVVGILSNPEATKNRAVRVHDFFISKNEIIAEIESITGEKWTVENEDSEKAVAESLAALSKGFSLALVQSFIRAHIPGKNTSATWDPNDDSELLGLPKKDMREEIQKVI